MLSVIFVPIISVVLIGVLAVLLSPRRKFDAPAAAQFQLKRALSFIESANSGLSKKDFKKLNILVNKARSYIERAKFEDVYDMTVPQDACIKARAITQSLVLVCPANATHYLNLVSAELQIATEYICANCGVTLASSQKMNLSKFSNKSKEDKARAHLEGLNKHN